MRKGKDHMVILADKRLTKADLLDDPDALARAVDPHARPVLPRTARQQREVRQRLNDGT
jgi:hypothetical protein